MSTNNELEKLTNYFKGDTLASHVWKDKYADTGEETPDHMHVRMAKKFAENERKYSKYYHDDLSDYGKVIPALTGENIYQFFKDFKYIVPQGSIMASLGTNKITSLSNCLQGDVKVLTRGGWKAIKELDGKNVEILTKGGGWVTAPFKNYGVQKLWELKLTNGNEEKVIYATKDHRWCTFKKGKKNSPASIKTTYQLQESITENKKEKLYSTYGKFRDFNLSSIGIAHGITYGDGHTIKDQNLANNITLCADSRVLGKYFVDNYISSDESNCEGGSDFYGSLPNFFREKPSIFENKSYLYGWLSGYFSADGHITKNGSVMICSSKKNDIEFVQDVCGVLGIGTTKITQQTVVSNLTKKNHIMYKCFIHKNHLKEDFFLLEKHKIRFKKNDKDPARFKVISVKETDKFETVYCAEVPTTESFVIEGNILSMNCFVIGQPEDSYSGIFQKDEELVQLMKRRGGVGIDISTLRPDTVPVNNAAKTTTGAASFMERYSNSTREVAQKGRRGALMLTIDCRHPDVFDFVNAKKDRTKVTGANISVMLRDDFMEAVKKDEDYLLRFPCDIELTGNEIKEYFLSYNELFQFDTDKYIKRIKAKDLYDQIVENAWENAEPGQMFVDQHWNFSPDSVYSEYKGVTTNPCFHPDTLIETINGRIKIKDITTSTIVYSMNIDGSLCTKRASASFISKKDAKTLKITLKSGSFIQVTPEHKLFVHDKGWVQAKDLKIKDKIAHLCRSRRGAKYSGVHLTTSPYGIKDQVMEHKLVYGKTSIKDADIHHIDGNTFNNTISNLEELSHSNHAKYTAKYQNPQTHQVKDSSGKFITHVNFKKGTKTIVNVPKELKTNVLSKFHNAVVSIEEGETTDVYDIQVEDTHCLVANNMIAHNCGEIFMQMYDACRLICINLFSIVENPFSKEAKINRQLLYKIAYTQQRLADNLVDLELEMIDRILDKIKKSKNPTSTEYNLWKNIRSTAEAGRRTGSGFTALGDMLAALNLKYDSDEALKVIEEVNKIKMSAELDCSIDLAILRGPFKGWNPSLEHENANEWYKFVSTEFPEQYARMQIYGRRNVSFSTVAPTGTVSLLTQTTSGLEPLFKAYYIRRKKVNPSQDNVRVDFIDQNGDSWMEYPVLHPKFIEWFFSKSVDEILTFEQTKSLLENYTKDEIQKLFEESPWFKSEADDINWLKRVEIQSIIQKYTSHSISSTINLPNNASKEDVAEIYIKAWESGLKGVTVYRDGCRTGVLVKDNNAKDSKKFAQIDAPKRPKELKCDIYTVMIKGEYWNIIVGLLEDQPYEVFAVTKFTNDKSGFLFKVKKGEYNLLNDKKELIYANITSINSFEEENITRLISMSLRHGANVSFICEQLTKTVGEIHSFSKGISRTLKHYIKDGTKSTLTCENCGEAAIIFVEGCQSCTNCGNSKCG